MTTPSTSPSPTIIIGGGLAGLVASIFLARANHSVTLLEKAAHLGGRAISQNHQDYIFNLGAHAVYERTEGAQILKELNIRYTAGEPRNIRAISHDKTYDFPANPRTLLGTTLFDLGGKLEATRALIALTTAKPASLQGTTLTQWLAQHTKHPGVRALITSTARTTTYTNAPELIDMGLVAEQIQVTAKGRILYIDGGWQTLVDGLVADARQAGVTIRTGVRAQSVNHTANHVTGVTLDDGTTLSASAVIIAAAPGDASRLLDNNTNKTLRAWADQSIPVRAACLDVALRQLPNPGTTVAIHMEKPLFLTVQSAYAKIAPAGGALIHTLKYLHPSDTTGPKTHEHELESWLDLTQSGWRDALVERRFLPNLIVSNALVTASTNGTAGRPGPNVPGFSNLYVVGDWVGPSGQLFSASLSSARLAARSLFTSSDILEAA
jgi:phytoene dehydrogenase-like protein